MLGAGREYPLFDTETNTLVRGGIELGIFAPVPVTRRLGARAAMANGLFDRLPNFQYATTSEILDIRAELSGALGAFRSGVRELSDEIDVAAEDPKFAYEIEDAWNSTVSPALDEIEEMIQQNRSMRDLMKRFVKDPIADATFGAAATLAVAAGPLGQYITAAGLVVGTALGTARALIGENEGIQNARKAQFYFLYGTNSTLGVSD